MEVAPQPKRLPLLLYSFVLALTCCPRITDLSKRKLLWRVALPPASSRFRGQVISSRSIATWDRAKTRTTSSAFSITGQPLFGCSFIMLHVPEQYNFPSHCAIFPLWKGLNSVNLLGMAICSLRWPLVMRHSTQTSFLIQSVDFWEVWTGSEANWVQVPALPLSSCVTLGKLPCLSESEFPKCKTGMPTSQDVVMITGQ